MTFPGSVLYTTAQRLFCDVVGVPVYKVHYLASFATFRGYLVHGEIPTLRSAFLICLGPLFVNTVVGAVLSFPAILPWFFLENEALSGETQILLWLGMSCGMQALPRDEDIQHFLFQTATAHRSGLLVFLARCFSIFMRVVNFLRRLWLDAFYAILTSIAVPWLVVRTFVTTP